jgi:hypothetical protein
MNRPDDNFGNLVAVYILLQIVLIVFAMVISDAIGIVVGMLALSTWGKLATLTGVCLLILCVLYYLRKRLLYHLSFEGISETVFPKKERERMLLLSKKWKANSLSDDERVELQSMVERTFLPSDVITVYSRRTFSLKEIIGYLLAFLFGLPLLALLLKVMFNDNKKTGNEAADDKLTDKNNDAVIEPETPTENPLPSYQSKSA